MRSLFIAFFILFALFPATVFAGISIIREDGTGDYTSLSAWESGENTDLVAANDSAIARIEGSWSSAGARTVINGWTTGPANYIRIYTATDARHSGKWSTTAFRLVASQSMQYLGILQIEENHVRVEGLQVHNTATQYCNALRLVPGANSDVRVSNCILRANQAGGGAGNSIVHFVNNNGFSGTFKMWNCILYDAAVDGFYLKWDVQAGKIVFYNNTFYNCTNGGIRLENSSLSIHPLVKNTIVQNCGDGFAGSTDPASDYNVSDLTGDAPGSNSRNSTTVTFVSTTTGSEDFRLALADAGARDYGADLSADSDLAFSTDVDGDARSTPWDIGADEVPVLPSEKDPNMYYSVGTSTAALFSGNGSVSSKGLLVLTTDAAANIGVGDEVRVGADRHYIRARESSRNFRIQNSAANGGAAGDTSMTFTSQAVSIYRAFNSLSAAIAGASDASHLGTANLVTYDFVLHLACYGDGADNTPVKFSGYATSGVNYLRAFTPVLSSEVGASQRHAGVWTSSGAYHMVVSNAGGATDYAVMSATNDHVKIIGLQIEYTGSSGVNAVEADGTNDSLEVGYNIIRYTGSAPGNNMSGIYVANGTGTRYALYNNIIYGWQTDATHNAYGIHLSSTNTNVGTPVYNNTVFDCEFGIQAFRNYGCMAIGNLVYNCTDNWIGTDSWASGSGYNLSGPAADAEIPGTNNQDGVTVSFVNTTAGSEDLHLSVGDAGAKNNGADLSADAKLAFADDIDGETRAAPWCIGADENAIVDLTPPVMGTISAPAGGATWTTGDAATITWSATDDIGLSNFVVKLSTDNGASWTQVADTSAGNVTAWTNGNLATTAPTNVASTTCLIRIIASDGSSVDSATTAAFNITDNDAPTVAVTAPNGGEAWPSTGTKTIEWADSDNVGVATCSLFYSLDNSSWTFIAATTGGVGTYLWALPDQQSVCWVRVRVTDAAGLQATDESDAEFNITTKPYFTCDDSVHVGQGGALNFNMEYDQGGIPGAAIVTALEKPSWVFQVGSVLLGTAPASDQVDTARVELNVSGYMDTLTLRIFIGSGGVGIEQASAVSAPVAFGLDCQPTAGQVLFRVGLPGGGNFQLTVFNSRGQQVWRSAGLSVRPGRHRLLWMPDARGVYMVTLTGNGKNAIQKIVALR